MRLIFNFLISNLSVLRLFYFVLLTTGTLFYKNNYKIFFLKKKVILALQDIRFKNDLEILEKHSNYIFYRLPYSFERRLFNPIIIKKKLKNYYKAFELNDNKKNLKIKNEVIFKYKKCFNFFFKLIGAKSLVSAAVHYKYDVLIGEIAKECNIKYIIFHKENFSPLKHQQENKIKFYSNFFRSKADLIITHNEITKKIFSDNLILKNKVSSIGALRFYNYNKLISKNFTKKIKKKVTFFSFTHRSGLYEKSIGVDFFFSDKGWINLFKNVHKSIYELAIENPEIEFVIKTKWEFEWHEQILKDIGHPKNLPNNLIISSNLGVLDLIRSSNTIVAFNSTVILESAIFGHKVICPNFNEVSKYNKFVMHNLFKKKIILAGTKNEFKKKIINRLKQRQNNKPLMKKEFKKYISPLKNNIVKMYLKKIDKIITE